MCVRTGVRNSPPRIDSNLLYYGLLSGADLTAGDQGQGAARELSCQCRPPLTISTASCVSSYSPPHYSRKSTHL